MTTCGSVPSCRAASPRSSEARPADSVSWKVHPEDIAEIVAWLLQMPERTIVSQVEIRPSKPPANHEFVHIARESMRDERCRIGDLGASKEMALGLPERFVERELKQGPSEKCQKGGGQYGTAKHPVGSRQKPGGTRHRSRPACAG